jgi:hypothetical protein
MFCDFDAHRISYCQRKHIRGLFNIRPPKPMALPPIGPQQSWIVQEKPKQAFQIQTSTNNPAASASDTGKFNCAYHGRGQNNNIRFSLR